jgi:hypothetical protein
MRRIKLRTGRRRIKRLRIVEGLVELSADKEIENYLEAEKAMSAIAWDIEECSECSTGGYVGQFTEIGDGQILCDACAERCYWDGWNWGCGTVPRSVNDVQPGLSVVTPRHLFLSAEALR